LKTATRDELIVFLKDQNGVIKKLEGIAQKHAQKAKELQKELDERPAPSAASPQSPDDGKIIEQLQSSLAQRTEQLKLIKSTYEAKISELNANVADLERRSASANVRLFFFYVFLHLAHPSSL